MPVDIGSGPPAIDGTAVPTEPIWRLSVDQYHEMIDVGILLDDDPVELLEGWLVQKMRNTPPHSLATQLVRAALKSLSPEGWFVGTHGLLTTRDSEPERDVLVVRGDPRQYASRHPSPKDLALVAEVADDSLRRDRTIKKRIYARARVPVYWIVNLIERQVEVYTGPTGPTAAPDYRRRRDYGPADELPLVIGRKEVGRLAVRDVLP